ncbi:SacI homology domain-containing protein, partial [Linnemannia elongata]
MQFRSDLAKSAPSNTEPFYRHLDQRFWWNEHLLKDLIDIRADGYILPVMQGYVEIEPCVIEEQSFEFTLISRRSRDRSGLRYQRRGIDEHGNTANFVETEQLLRIVRHDSDHQVSFVQTRGSIPLFWSQSPYRLKPIPVMERTEQENYQGFSSHFGMQRSRYGRQICINLVEQHGREQVAGSAYTRYIQKLNEPEIRYVEFDFHEQCKGMRYENIERLIKSLESPIQELGYCWLAPRNEGAANNRKDGESWERLYDQKGVIRTNCMDCLDRTNVVQSAISRHVLNHQLLRLGIASFPDKGLSVYEEFENIFNHVWANNGDAISREYAGTSALKGDFTRTGKRNLQGMINDATNSVARMYQNTFKDYFRQAAIDYLLGSADLDVFKNLQTTAFGTAEAWVKIREAAIETSAEIVISPGEEVWQGWTFSNSGSNFGTAGDASDASSTVFYDEKVVLLTERALYICTYDYEMEKVLEFWRLALEKITGIDKGTYFLTAQDKTPQGQDPLENYGFAVMYRANAGGETLRVNSGSVRNR